jgi:enoyl-CoA hydratase/carnithine racemase
VSSPVIFDIYSHVARIKLNSPETGNVVNDDNLSLLYKYVTECGKNDECRVIVIEGSHGIFSRGMDFKNLIKNSDRKIDTSFSEPYIKAVMAVRNSPKPVIAAIDGEVLAGGMGIALACDIVIATKRSVFGLSEVIFGIIPAYVFPFLLERTNFKKARFIVLSSRKFRAEEYYRFGIIDDLAEDEKLEKKLTEYIKRLLCSSPYALSLVKAYSDKIKDKEISEAVKTATNELTCLLNNEKSIDSIKAFLEGEPIEWMTKYKRKKHEE